MTTRYDLHSHSLASDGTLSPRQLVAAAAGAGVDVLALTDHDTTDGLFEAGEAAATAGMRLVSGVEISVTWQGQTVHILGLGIAPDCEPLQAGLQSLRGFRDWRAVEIGRRLAKAGIPGTYERARELASGRIVSRTHFARCLVELGHADNMKKVFRRYLVNGKPGHVSGEWAELEAVLGWIREAGGIAVIAHPARYNMTSTKLRRLVGEFRECGGEALEVVSGSHSANDVTAMAALARNEKLLASCGSDFHGPENPWVRLGELATIPDGCRPVWESGRWPLN